MGKKIFFCYPITIRNFLNISWMWFMGAGVFFFAMAFWLSAYHSPLKITLINQQKLYLDTGSLLKLNLNLEASKISVQKLKDQIILNPQKSGTGLGQILLFNAIKLKDVEVRVVDEQKVVAMGNAVGMHLNLEGVLVESTTGVLNRDFQQVMPAKDAGLRRGDFIQKVNGNRIRSVDDLKIQINHSNGKTITLDILRSGKRITVDVTPISSLDGNYRIGLWVKDTINGIGTITFVQPSKAYRFAGLGHGITSMEANEVVPIQGGEVFYTEIEAIQKGFTGHPGELKGNLLLDFHIMGSIEKNTATGVFGRLNADWVSQGPQNTFFVGYEQHVRRGRAYILSNIEGNTVKKYAIEIEKITHSAFKNPKGMVIDIVDKELLSKTGGIVQGMSGSPIIQNNRLIGAVTHVLVNQPSKGYGIFIEEMFKQW